MLKDIRSLPRHLPIVQQAYRLRSGARIQHKQHPICLGRHILWTTKGNLLITYKAMGRSIINNAASKLDDTNYRSIQYTPNEALRIATGCHKMSSIDHLHAEAKLLKARDTRSHYLPSISLRPDNVCHPIPTRCRPKRQTKKTLFTSYRNTVRAGYNSK